MENQSKKFVVIGGQYANYYYGATETIEQAKRLATKNVELWDNFQGEHKPAIYKIEDCEKITNSLNHPYQPSEEVYAPKIKYWDVPCSAYMSWNGKKWEKVTEE